MTLERRTGLVTAVNAGPPPTVTIQVGGDTATSYDAPYLDSYAPGVDDVVQVLSDGGYHVVLGRATLGAARSVTTRSTSVGGISAATDLANLPTAIEVDGTQDVDLHWSWDSITGTVAGDRIALRPSASLNGGAYTQIGRLLIKVTASPSAEGGGAGFLTHRAPAAGLWTYKIVGAIDAGTGTFTLNAGTGTTGPMTFSAERKG